MAIDKSWTKIRRWNSSVEFWNGLQKFLQMVKPFANDRGLIRYPCNRCINNEKQQLDMIENRIFCYGFMGGYEVWIYHGDNENDTVNLNVPE